MQIPDLKDDPLNIISYLCSHFYSLGWATGTGGGMSVKVDNKVYIAPSGVQKELIKPEDIYVLEFPSGIILRTPQNASLKISQCTPLFWSCYSLRSTTNACIHSHSINAVLATILAAEDELRISNLEMIKGIKRGESYKNFSCFDELIIPIIHNTAHEEELQSTLEDAIIRYSESNAVLVRNHGIYVWGKSWEEAKSMAECYHYILQCFVELKRLGISYHH